MPVRGVRDTGISHGIPILMGIPWEWKHRLNSWEWEREWEWWSRNGREMGIVVWKKFPSVALVGWLAEQFAISS